MDVALREVLVVAGETSGDLHAATVVEALRRLAPALPVAGVGGARMRAAGANMLEDMTAHAVMGYAGVVRQIPAHLRLLRRLRARMEGGTVGLIILVDYPGFNLRVASAAKAAGVPVLWYITPKVWAWRAGRIDEMRRTISRAAVILPFEQDYLRARGIAATYVGNPLLDGASEIPSRERARAKLGLAAGEPVLALFPGSRTGELAHHLEAFTATAVELQRRIPGLRVIVGVAPGMRIDPARAPFQLVEGDSYTVWRAADAALVKSGTSTLEAAIAGTPLIVAYRVGRLNYEIARRLLRGIKYIGLVNLVVDRSVAPEFIQNEMQPLAMANALEPLLTHGSNARNTMLSALASVRTALGEAGAGERVARLALETFA
ncbi:MAG: lipid-A-disaccharide synthase [Gemmatimonadota bacterium]|nr:lipid-A-disaccharide synthase [Gemmatimonadota bacterium]